MSEKNNDKYFADYTIVGDELADNLIEKIKKYDEFIGERTKLFDLWQKGWAEIYYAYHSVGDILAEGDKGERLIYNSNEIRTALNHVHNTITSAPVFFQPRAKRSDTDSLQASNTARLILEAYYRETGEEANNSECVWDAFYCGAATQTVLWDEDAGDELINQDGSKSGKKKGDNVFRIHLEPDVVRDVEVRDAQKNKWWAVRIWYDKFELASKYPDYAEKIKALSGTKYRRTGFSMRRDDSRYQGDQVACYYFFHDRCKPLENGRYTIFLEDKTILKDGMDLGYKRMPLARLYAGVFKDMNFGYGHIFELLAPQQYHRMLTSAIATNQAAGAISNFWHNNMQGGVVTKEIGKGMRLFEGPGDPPSPINMLQTSPEVFNSVGMAKEMINTPLAVSPVNSGQAQEGMSGKAIGFLAAETKQFNMSFDKSFTAFVETKATLAIENIQQFATVERVIEYVGKNNKADAVSFVGKDLDCIKTISIDRGNPLTSTQANREQFAKWLMETGITKDVEALLTVVTTGSVEPLIENKNKERMLILQENEEIQKGVAPIVSLNDNHLAHISRDGHGAVDASIAARRDPKIMKALQEHQMAHLNMLLDLNMNTPELAMLLGQSVPMAPPPAPPPGEPSPMPMEGAPPLAPAGPAPSPVTVPV